MVQLLWKTAGPFLTKVNIHLPNNPAIPLLPIYPIEMKTYVRTRDLLTNVRGSLFDNSPKLETAQMFNRRMIKQTVCIAQTMEYFSETKRNGFVIHATAWMSRKSIMLS